LGVTIHRCERLVSDPPGDPAMLRFREAVGSGAIPFTVQGPENALCLDGGRTIAWEMVDQAAALGIELDRVFVQVGGGAFATCMGDGFNASASVARLHAVQAAGCAPLARGWDRAGALDRPEQHWGDVMIVWDDPHSLADGILDDETYDWIGVFENLRRSGGDAVVASESQIERAHAMAVDDGFDGSAARFRIVPPCGPLLVHSPTPAIRRCGSSAAARRRTRRRDFRAGAVMANLLDGHDPGSGRSKSQGVPRISIGFR